MEKRNRIQFLLDFYLKYKRNNSGSEKSFEEVISKQTSMDEAVEVDASKDINQLFFAIKSKESTITKPDKFEVLCEQIDFSEKTFVLDSKPSSFLRAVMKIAAVIIPIAVLASYFIFSINEKSAFENLLTASTSKGSKTKLELEDGTIVWLNADSKLKFPSTFKNKSKRIVFLSGEAFFDVKRNEKKPFEVIVKDYKVNVLGTSFNIKAYPNEESIETTLKQGKVDIEKFSCISKKETEKIVTLKPNQTLVIYDDKNYELAEEVNSNKDETKVEKAEKIEIVEEDNMQLIESKDLAPYISWKDNELTFKNELLKNIISDLERWYNIKIEIANDELKDIKFTATFTTETVEQAIYAICVASQIDYEIHKNQVILKTKKN